jgi:hypothetical protein
MGAWGTGPFDNDTACDWSYGLEESTDFSLIEETLSKVLSVGAGELEASDAEEALAALETLAKLLGRGGQKDSYTEAVDKWVKGIKIKPSSELLQKGLATLERIQSPPSELLELWEEDKEWKESLADLKKRLQEIREP